MELRDGSPVQDEKQATYLGAKITNRGDVHAEVKNRLSKASSTAWALNGLWKHETCEMKWKPKVFNAAIVAQLTYGF